MRDPKLARLQFFSGLVFLTLAVWIAAKMLLPQWQTYRQNVSMSKSAPASSSSPSGFVNNMPMASTRYGGWWKKEIFQPLEASAQQTKVSLSPLEGDYAHFKVLQDLPDPLRQVSLKVSVKGSYEGLLAFLEALKLQLPSAQISMFHLTKEKDATWTLHMGLDVLVATTS